MPRIEFTPHGVCSRKIIVEHEDGIITKCQFIGGCNGNTQGISSLVIGMKVEDVVSRLKGISCNGRPTSCPDQLSKALEESSK